MRTCRGFTLVELLVVVAIIGVLSTIGLASFQEAMSKTRKTQKTADVDALAKVFESKYNFTTGEYPAAISGADFTSGKVPDGAISVSPDKKSFTVCTDLNNSANSPSCTISTSSCYCRTSSFDTPSIAAVGSTAADDNEDGSSTLSGSGAGGPTSTSDPTPTAQTTTLTTIDDGYSINNWGHNETTPNVRIGSNYAAGFRFALPIPINAQITSATMTVYANLTSSPTTVNMKAENTLNSAALTGNNTFIPNRTYFSNSTSWSLNGNGVSITSPDIKTLIQNIVNQPNWQANNNILLALLKTNTDYGDLVSKEGDTNKAVKLTVNYTNPAATATPAPSSARDPLKWPFASNSIWNMPIGSNAVYVPANLNPNPGNIREEWRPGLPSIDDEIIVVKPTSPLTDVNYSDAAWTGRNRCAATGTQRLLTKVNMPADFIVPHGDGNNAATFLNADNRTLQMIQPLARCTTGGYATALLKFADVDIYGEGRQGAHGGSSLSSFGGSIRLGELRPGQVGIKHALKVNVYAKEALYNCSNPNDCFRWPAYNADGAAPNEYGTLNNNQNTAMKMGALLAIPASVNIDSLGLESEPGRQLAWTLQNYGAYIVDDTYGPAFALNAETGPDGSKRDEFQRDWGMKFENWGWNSYTNTPWERDIQKLISALYVIDNNTSTSIGGGGTPRQPLAPQIGEVAGISARRILQEIISFFTSKL